jgi:hypothetical protein
MARRLLTAAFASLALFAGAAAACEPTCTYKKVVRYETKVEWVTKVEAFTKEVTLYDHCGKPYTVEKVAFREVEVPVEKQVPVVKWVKVSD